MKIYQKRFLKSYLDSKDKLDRNIYSFVSKKEDYICQDPKSNSLLKDNLNGIRRYKNKIRILYAIYGEFDCHLFEEEEDPTVYFMYVALRKDNTYKDAYKYLKKQGVFD